MTIITQNSKVVKYSILDRNEESAIIYVKLEFDSPQFVSCNQDYDILNIEVVDGLKFEANLISLILD